MTAPISGPSGKDPSIAFLIELVGGFFGLLGLGYIFVGRTQEGITRLIVWLIYVAVIWCIITVASALLIGLLCIPIQIVIQIVVPIWSAYSLKKQMDSGLI
jgi:hypothetical protein